MNKPSLFRGLIFTMMFLFVPIFSQNPVVLAAPAGVLSSQYSVRAPARLGQGLVNTLLGWTAFFTEPVRSVRGGGTAADGFFRGLAYPFSYTFLGVWDLGTFWVPGMMGAEMAVPLTAFQPSHAKAAA